MLYELPDSTRVFVGHDYPTPDRPLRFETTIGEAKQKNAHIRPDTTSAEFVALRTGRDQRLSPPRLIDPSLRTNIAAGRVWRAGKSDTRT